MSDTVKLATARSLVHAGAIRGAEVIGLPGGWTLQLQTYAQPKVLATKEGEPRRFGTFESVLKVLLDLGLRTDGLQVNAAHWSATGVLGVRRRPDRSAAMRLKDEDARYAAFLREAVAEVRTDTRPAVSAADAARQMAKARADRQAKLTLAMQGKGGAK